MSLEEDAAPAEEGAQADDLGAVRGPDGIALPLRSPIAELSLVALVGLLYGDALGYGYLWDDHWLISLRPTDILASSLQTLHVRPIWYLSYVLSQGLVASAAFEHLVSLAMFALSVALAFRLAVAFGCRRPVAWAIAAIWALLPWNAYPAVWIAQRNDLLMFLFGFSALLLMRRERWGLAWLCMALAVLSKSTIAFVPLFFAWRAREKGLRRTALAFVVLFTVYMGLSLRAYVLYLEPSAHVEQLSWLLRLARFPLHWLEHMLLLALPVPFLLGIAHTAIYAVGLVGFLVTSRRATGGPGVESVGRDLWLLALFASLPAMVTPELRICGLESLFWLLVLARMRAWPPRAALALAVLLGAYAAGSMATKTLFDTRRVAPSSEERHDLYPNDYYRQRRELLSSWFGSGAG